MSAKVFLYLTASSVGIGIMSILRKKYQLQNGVTLVPTLIFIALSGFVGTIVGSLAGLSGSLLGWLFAFFYAIISSVTAAICICATAYGNVSILILSAMLGSLVIPTLFGIITQPSENVLTLWKELGFLCAALCLLLNFMSGRKKEKNNLRFKLFCIIVFFTNGSALVIFNLKNRLCTDVSEYAFISEYMILTCLLALLYVGILYTKNKNKVFTEFKQALRTKNYILIAEYSILFFASEVLALKCSGMIPLIIQAPFSYAIPIITIAIIDYFAYGVKLNKLGMAQIAISFLCCLCFIAEQ